MAQRNDNADNLSLRNNDSLLTSRIEDYVKGFGNTLQICIPVIVDDVIEDNWPKVKVKPLVNIPVFDSVKHKVEYDEPPTFLVNVYHFGNDAWHLVFPIRKGMTGWVISSDKDAYAARKANSNIDVEENIGNVDPASLDMGQYTQGFFIPDRWMPVPDPEEGLDYHRGIKDDNDDFRDCFGIQLKDKKVGIYLHDDASFTVISNDTKIRLDGESVKIEAAGGGISLDSEGSITFKDKQFQGIDVLAPGGSVKTIWAFA